MITAQRQIKADPHRVWKFVGDVGRWADYLPTVTSVSLQSGSARPEVGSRYAIKQPGIAVLVYEITNYQPETGFEWVATSPGVRTLAPTTSKRHPVAAPCDSPDGGKDRSPPSSDDSSADEPTGMFS